MAQFEIGALWGEKNPVTMLMKASDALKVMDKCSHVLVTDPSLFLRLGLLEALEGQKDVGSLIPATEELRFGLMEGRCIDPSRFLFGTSLPPELVAKRMGMEAEALLLLSTAGPERLKAWLTVLKRIGETIWE
jgi:hypothetical protein